MKSRLGLFLCFVLLVLTFSSTVHAEEKYSVYFDGELVKVEPLTVDKQMYFDLKQIFTATGYKYHYEAKTKTLIINKIYSTGQKEIRLKIGEKKFTLNGKPFVTTQPAITKNNKTLITPLFFSEVVEKKLAISQKEQIINFGNYNMANLGSIKGVITWQYNKVIGTKADVGANVVLIPIDYTERIHDTTFGLTLTAIPNGSNGL